MKAVVNEVDKRNKIFSNIALVLLLLLVFCIPVFVTIRAIDNSFSVSNAIHTFNCYICVISLFIQAVYWFPNFKDLILNWKKTSFKEKLSKNWPLIILAIFMAWTAVGCIQASMEMNAEITVKTAKNIDEVPQRIIDIANWSSGDRMASTTDMWHNAAARSWFGCENLRDGYFSFLFYASVMLNVLMLGKNAENKKKWILRAFLISSFLISFVDVLSFFRPLPFANVFNYRSFSFNNYNHYAYYYTVVAIMSVVMFIKEKNIYFKVLSLINVILYFFIMIFNNTFGAQLGITFAMVFLLLVTLIRLVSRHKVKEFVLYLVTLGLFLYAIFGIGNISVNTYGKGDLHFSVSTFSFRFMGNNYRFYSNSLSSEEAEEAGIAKAVINNKQVEWGTSITKLDKDFTSSFSVNVNKFIKDADVIFTFFGLKSSDSTEKAESEQITTVPEKMQELETKYPKISGETLEEYNARQEKIEKEFEEWYNKVFAPSSGNLSTENNEVVDSDGLSDEVASAGSGRGEVWIRSLDLMNERPFFGWGLENILQEFYQQFGIGEGRTHNLMLQLGACTGIVGVLLYFVGTIAIFLKSLYDVKLRKYSKTGVIIIIAVFVILTILANILVSKITNKLLFNGLVTVILWAFLYMCIFFKNVRLRVKDWNYFEMIGATVFVSYMIGALVGNSAFYTSPYFTLFLGILLFEVLNKTPRFEEEKAVVNEEKLEEKTKIVEELSDKVEVKDDEIKEVVNEKKIVSNNTKAKSNKNNKKKKRR